MELTKLVFRQGAPIKPLIEAMGVVPVIAIVAAMIDRYCSQFNVSKNMNQTQIEDLAADLVLGFKTRQGNSVMLEELAIFFDRAAKGEFEKKGKKLVPFDRIDRGLIEEMLDVYFETDRTQAVWAIEDELNARRVEPEPSDTLRLSGPASPEPVSVGDMYTRLAGQPDKMRLAKMFNELEERYGEGAKNEQ